MCTISQVINSQLCLSTKRGSWEWASQCLPLSKHSQSNLQEAIKMGEKTPPGFLKGLKYPSYRSGQSRHGGILTPSSFVILCMALISQEFRITKYNMATGLSLSSRSLLNFLIVSLYKYNHCNVSTVIFLVGHIMFPEYLLITFPLWQHIG